MNMPVKVEYFKNPKNSRFFEKNVGHCTRFEIKNAPNADFD